MTLYQIAKYPFHLRVTGQPSIGVESMLDAVLAHFQSHLSCAPVIINHEPLTIETSVCDIRFMASAHTPQIEIDVRAKVDTIDVIDYVEPEIVNQAIRESSGLLWIHGACLVRGDECILLVAKTGTGKTTLSLGLLAHGYQLITDDIILIDLEKQQIIPVPRCPKIRPPAPNFLRDVGFDLTHEAQMYGRYVVLPPNRIHAQPITASIKYTYLLSRTPDLPGQTHMLDSTSGILGLLNHSNLLAIDPSLTQAHELFAQTTFIEYHLSDFVNDLSSIAGKI